ncbi:hypothetical protein [Spirillospora albida]|uniref:hypothetical protein n=1 Tax=Spirillospora albida TaxID=58123 RepID=UPI0012FA2A5A|nr:hypothetical protein [Spirillospora albida]
MALGTKGRGQPSRARLTLDAAGNREDRYGGEPGMDWPTAVVIVSIVFALTAVITTYLSRK